MYKPEQKFHIVTGLQYDDTIYCETEEQVYEELAKLPKSTIKGLCVYENINERIQEKGKFAELLEQYNLEKVKKLNEFTNKLWDLNMMIYYSNRLDSKDFQYLIEATDLLKLEFNFKFNDFLKLRKEYPNIKLDHDIDDWEFYPDLPIEDLPDEQFP